MYCMVKVAGGINVSDRLKQAYASGFAGALEKSAGAQLTEEEIARIEDMVKQYSVERRKRTLLGLLGIRKDTETEQVPGVDIMGQRMDEKYFHPDWKPRGLLMRTKGPDPLGRFPGVEKDPYGTMYY